MIKKHCSVLALILAVIGTGLLYSTNVFAASCSGTDTSIINCDVGGDGGIFYILSLVLNILAIGIGIVGVIGITWAGIQYLTAGGDTSRTTKAKRRLLEIVIGLTCYTVFYVFMGWLMPNGVTNGDTTGVSNVSISYQGKAYVGSTIVPKVTFNDEAKNKTYSLKSGNTSIAKTAGTNVKCLEVGEVSIEAVTANGKKASVSIKCEESPSATSNGDSNNNSNNNTTNNSSETVGSMLNTKLNGKPNMRKATQKIIDDHRTDFFYNNYSSKIKKYGGYKKYLTNTLGGVFAKYANKKIKVKTAADFQEAAEYVYGLWTVWGTDYDNGGTHHTWRRGASWKGGKNDGFYAGLPGRSDIHRYGSGNINEILSKSSNIRTNCNFAVNTFRATTNLKSIGGASLHESQHLKMSKVGKITKLKDLRVGDVVHFFGGDGGWMHVAMVGEVYKDYIVLYDGGSLFINNGNYKHKRTSGSKMTNDYSYYGSRWWAFRPWDINQNVTLKGIN